MKKLLITALLPFVFFILPACKHPTKDVQDAKKELGHYLFYEKKLSVNQSKSCGSCHSPEFAFTDGYRKSVSAYGENLLHNAPSLLNLTGNHYFDWDNPSVRSLEVQIKRPLYNTHPVEMGCDFSNAKLQKFFHEDSLYRTLFSLAYPYQDVVYTAAQIEECIIAFVQTLLVRNSRYDRYQQGDQTALTQKELHGLQLFQSSRLQCSSCHRPPHFSLSYFSADPDSVYVNIGLYNLSGQNTYPSADQGLRRFTKRSEHDGKFKIPSLRNVMLTAPYMHDGSVADLQQVIDLYARGGRNTTVGDYPGDGAKHKNKHPLIRGFELSAEEKDDLIQFLSALTDTSYLSNPQFRDPFRK